MDDIKPTWGDIKYLYENLVIKIDWLGSFNGGILNAIGSDFIENKNKKDENHQR